MSHKITTTVRHAFDLTAAEQFDETGWRKTALRIDTFIATVIDGSLSSVKMYGRPVLKSGALGQTRNDLSARKPYPEHVRTILRAHGIPLPGEPA